jgi:hypothetical protein
VEKIINAKDKKVSDLNSALPDVMAAVQELLRDTVVVCVQKQQIDGYTQEVPVSIQTKACIQPGSAEQLKIMPEGQRAWKYAAIWTLPNVNLLLDDVFWINDQGYRILDKTNWSRYGYIQYDCIEDYTEAPNVTG